MKFGAVFSSSPVLWMRRFILCLVLCLQACGNGEPKSLIQFEGATMGTYFRVSVFADSSIDSDILEQSVINELDRINRSMSTYIVDSEVSRINRAKAGQVIPLSTDLRSVLREANEISMLTEGAFDITLGPAVDLWGFGPPGGIDIEPSQKALDQLRLSTGFSKLSLTEQGVVKQHDDSRLDLSAIAKGFAVDKIGELLKKAGHGNYLVDVGGELQASGMKAQGASWKVGIESPEESGAIQLSINLDNKSIATSGDYRNYVSLNGRKYSHTIDHQTLRPVLHSLASATVIVDSAIQADALATALLAMGEDQAIHFANKHGISAYLIVRSEDNNLLTRQSDEFAKLLE